MGIRIERRNERNENYYSELGNWNGISCFNHSMEIKSEEMKNNFKVGDRVRVRGTGIKGTVTCVDKVFIDFKEDEVVDNFLNYHFEKLKKLKPRRRFWINTYKRVTGIESYVFLSKEDADLKCGYGRIECFEVIEVRRDKLPPSKE